MDNGGRQTREAGRIAVRLMGAALAMGLAVSAQAAKAPAGALKAKAATKSAVSDWRGSAGFVIPGITTSLQARVGMIKHRFPVYAGVDVDLMFAYFYTVVAPMASVTVLFPIKAMFTPTAGIAIGPSFDIGGGRYWYRGGDGSGIGLAFLVKPGALINIDKGIDVDVQLQLGTLGGYFMVLPQGGVRFQI